MSPFILDLTYDPLPKTEISQPLFEELHRSSPKRIRCIDHWIINDDVRDDGWAKAFINVPFTETIQCILCGMAGPLGFKRNESGRFWTGIDNNESLEIIKKFLSYNDRIVFIKSLLSCMIALDMNFESETENHTEIGHHEHQAKESQNDKSIEYIINKLVKTINTFPFYKDAYGIIAVPKSTGSTFCFPQIVAEELANQKIIRNFSKLLEFKNKTKSLQKENIDNKWTTLEGSNLTIDPELAEAIKGKTLILLDDLYQSGTTMHYTAMRLQESGAEHILGLAIVKARSDTDNSKS